MVEVVYTDKHLRRVFAAMHTLKHMQRFLPFHFKLLLVKSLVFPYLLFVQRCGLGHGLRPWIWQINCKNVKIVA